MHTTLLRLAPALCLLAGLSAACGSDSDQAGADQCQYVRTGEAAKPVELPRSSGVSTTGTVAYVLKTTEGDVTITLDRAKTPCTVNSFESLADQGYFDKTRCHRLVDSGIFLLQCGDPTASGSGGPGYTFADETDGTESYTAGVVAMANAGPNTNGSQFFLVYDDSTQLDATPNYTVFGTMDQTSRGVVAIMSREGQDGTNPAGGGRPNNPAEILSVTKKG
ncbi:MAG TPA: peptidylprolyl isomerase [Propionibacteriaceae bacterium]|nr:peptidylprolyl isomerase [Propionibacteriaceae bacterium]